MTPRRRRVQTKSDNGRQPKKVTTVEISRYVDKTKGKQSTSRGSGADMELGIMPWCWGAMQWSLGSGQFMLMEVW